MSIEEAKKELKFCLKEGNCTTCDYGSGGKSILSCREMLTKCLTALENSAEVVRCKDCKFFISDICRHDFAMNFCREDDFCSHGERKEE